MASRKPIKLPFRLPDKELWQIITTGAIERDRLIQLLMYLENSRVWEVCQLEVRPLVYSKMLLFVNQGKGGYDGYLLIPKLLLLAVSGRIAARMSV